jgi:hypothetical protein
MRTAELFMVVLPLGIASDGLSAGHAVGLTDWIQW